MKYALCFAFCATLVMAAPALANLRTPDLTISGDTNHPVRLLAYSADRQYLAVIGGAEGVIRIYDARLSNEKLLNQSKDATNRSGQIIGIGFSDTNTLVSISVGDQSARIWDVSAGKLLRKHKIEFGNQPRFVIAPGNKPWAADISVGTVRLWNYETGELLHTLDTNDSWARILAFSPEGNLLVVGTEKGVVRLVDIATWKVTRTIDLDTPVHSLAASRNHILVGYGEGTVAVLNFGEQMTIPELKEQTGSINALMFSQDGERFASASADGTVKVWDADTLKLLYSLEGQGGEVLSVAFGPNGGSLVSGDSAGNVNFWNLPSTNLPKAP